MSYKLVSGFWRQVGRAQGHPGLYHQSSYRSNLTNTVLANESAAPRDWEINLVIQMVYQ